MTISMLLLNQAAAVVIAALSTRVIFLHRKYKRLEIDIAVVKIENATLRHSLTASNKVRDDKTWELMNIKNVQRRLGKPI